MRGGGDACGTYLPLSYAALSPAAGRFHSSIPRRRASLASVEPPALTALAQRVPSVKEAERYDEDAKEAAMTGQAPSGPGRGGPGARCRPQRTGRLTGVAFPARPVLCGAGRGDCPGGIAMRTVMHSSWCVIVSRIQASATDTIRGVSKYNYYYESYSYYYESYN